MYGRVMVALNCGHSLGGRLGLGWLKVKVLYPLSCSDVWMWWSSCFKLSWSKVLKVWRSKVLWLADLKRGWWNEKLCRYWSVHMSLSCTVWARVPSALQVTWTSREGVVISPLLHGEFDEWMLVVQVLEEQLSCRGPNHKGCHQCCKASDWGKHQHSRWCPVQTLPWTNLLGLGIKEIPWWPKRFAHGTSPSHIETNFSE